MRDWRKWRADSERRRHAARRAAQIRWDRHHAEQSDVVARATRSVELSIRDTHRPMRIIRMEAEEREHGWGRWAAWENETRIGSRQFGRSKIAELIARSLF